jgi:hypothetical protein
VQSDPHLKKIMALAGRYRRLAQARQRNKPTHGYDDMVGPDIGSDVGRLLPSELASLAVPGLDDDVLVRLVQGQARVRDLRTLEPEGKGPIVVAVDESSSMEDADRIHQAKALALAMAWVARHQRRWCCLLAWSSKGQRRHIVLPPGGWDEGALLGWLLAFWRGGTDLPLEDMPKLWQEAGAPKGRTDILLITDGICGVADQERDAFLAWKAQAQAKMHTLVIVCTTAAKFEWPAVEPKTAKLGSVLDENAEGWFDRNTKAWLFNHWDVQTAKGNGFAPTPVTAESAEVGTIGKRYFAIQGDSPVVAHPTLPGTVRLFSINEVKRLHGIPTDYFLGDSKTTAGEIMGQGVVVTTFEKVIRAARA